MYWRGVFQRRNSAKKSSIICGEKTQQNLERKYPAFHRKKHFYRRSKRRINVETTLVGQNHSCWSKKAIIYRRLREIWSKNDVFFKKSCLIFSDKLAVLKIWNSKNIDFEVRLSILWKYGLEIHKICFDFQARDRKNINWFLLLSHC